ncbi:MAG: STAS domain-containing protein [Chloroflexi bacterium]|nr:STAS domain-containing protein [Ardenticatenaceae bacterium]MBL1130442.1 anti-sigma factor antagonist [Chloroflexota bacterium]NOG36532.1 STAS domain-containing protein [Chloroflexota bacterium]GIK58939.1 MAG: anti-sigma factor antagonist [Chloroflexota bacterium]
MSETNLNLTTEVFKRVTLVKASGRIDSSNAAQFDAALKDVLGGGLENIVLDLSEISYMSSAGLRAIVAAHRECAKKKGSLVLAAPSERVSEVFSLAGLDSIFTVYDDVTAAVGSF